MAQKEKIGMRDLVYSQWHRAPSLGRFIPNAEHQYLSDLDGLEYLYKDKLVHPWFLYDIGRDMGQKEKNSPILPALSRKLGIRSAIVLYKYSTRLNPFADHTTIINGVKEALDELEKCGGIRDIESFRVQEVGKKNWVEMSPETYGLFLMRMKQNFIQSL
jgi:hypothetical protein